MLAGVRRLVALFLAACAARFSGADRAAVTAVIEQQRAAWNRGDLAGYMDGYARTPELVFTSGGAGPSRSASSRSRSRRSRAGSRAAPPRWWRPGARRAWAARS